MKKIILILLALYSSLGAMAQEEKPSFHKNYISLDLLPGLIQKAPSVEWNYYPFNPVVGLLLEARIVSNPKIHFNDGNYYRYHSVLTGEGLGSGLGFVLRPSDPLKRRTQITFSYLFEYSQLDKKFKTYLYETSTAHDNAPTRFLYTHSRSLFYCNIIKMNFLFHLKKTWGLSFSMGLRWGKAIIQDLPGTECQLGLLPELNNKVVYVGQGDFHLKLFFRIK